MNISDPTGQVAGIALFPDDADRVRAVFDKTTQVVMTLEAKFNEGQFDPVGRSVAPIDSVVADAGASGLRIMIDEPSAAQTVADLLAHASAAATTAGRGPILLRLFNPSLPGEVDMDTGMEFPVTPQIKGALKSLDGVLSVEEI